MRKPVTNSTAGNDEVKEEEELEPVSSEVNTIPTLMVAIDLQGRILSFNKACEQTTGYSFNELRGREVWDLFLSSAEREQFQAICSQLQAGSSSEYQYESDWITKEGFRRRITWSHTVLLGRENRIEGIISTGMDITVSQSSDLELKQLQLLSLITMKIRQSLQIEEILKTTVTEVRNFLQADRVLIYRLWSDGSGSGVTEAIAPGWEAILGKTFEPEVFPEDYRKLYAAGRVRAINDVENADICPCLVEFLQQFGVKAKIVVPILLKDDLWGLLVAHQCVESRQWLSFEIELLKQLADQLSIALAQAEYQEHLEELVAQRTAELTRTLEHLQQEITERKRAEDVVYHREQEFKALVENSPDLIARFDREFRHIYVNPSVERITGIPKQKFIGKTNQDLGMPEELVTCWHKALTNVLATGREQTIEFDFPGSQGIQSFQSRIVPEFTQDGSVGRLLSVTHDITQRKQAEEELRQSEARFRELAQREALLNQLASQIRRSLDLNTILETAVHEIRNLLQIDRCFFLWYRPNREPPVWEVVQESKTSLFPSLMGYCVPITTFGPLTIRVFNKEITRVDSARALTDPVERKFFFSIGYTALLALPIHTTYGEVGVVSCGHSGGSRPWQDSEVELLRAVADQLAIAIDQAHLLEQSRTATAKATQQATQLEKTLAELQQAQIQLVQSEKMSSLGQLVAGIAHEINNPVSFIYGNLNYLNNYIEDLLNLVERYQTDAPQPSPEIHALAKEIDIDFIREDLPKLLRSMRIGSERISKIVRSLQNFSRLDEAEIKWVDIHEGIDNSLLLLAHRFKTKQSSYPDIEVIKDYGDLPKVQCYPGQLNQVFMNILSNAIDAIEEYNKNRSHEEREKQPSRIWISTEVLPDCNQVAILIGDNGPGMTQEVCHRLFDPFFTTKPVGQGTGLGMSASYQIVVHKHQGQVQCISAPGYGTVFLIYIPIEQSK